MVELDAQSFKSAILNERVIVDFWAPWCHPCKVISPLLESLESEYPEYKFYKLNVDEPDTNEIMEEFGISGIPTIILFKFGEPVARSVGAVPKDTLKASLGLD